MGHTPRIPPLFSDNCQSAGHSTSWHLARGTHNTRTTPLFWPPDRVDITTTMPQLRALHAGERPESRVASVTLGLTLTGAGAEPRGPATVPLGHTSEREVGTWLSPSCPRLVGARERLRSQPLFASRSSFPSDSCLRGAQREACRLKADDVTQGWTGSADLKPSLA